ncbi:MAG TPA: DUF2703 domain-containing protein [Acidobacteriaceae bacterium]|nr:DUF2703 domain-containing protein [Acidobacteriaceae bacterium]
MKIEVLYFQGCPHYHDTVEQVRRALTAEGITYILEEIEVQDENMAHATGFLGSPSVRINGGDIEEDARVGQQAGFGCRTYLDGGRRSGVPPVEMIRKALREAANPGAGGGSEQT